MSYFIIKKVTPKDGVVREIHEEVLGRRCYILDLQIGQRGWIKFEPSYDPGCFHRLHTSTVVSYKMADDESWAEIETINTTYRLERLENLSSYFEDTRRFTREDAMDDVEKYLSSQPDKYFADRGTTRDAVLCDDGILADIAAEHYKCVLHFGNDREWSCKDACDSDPGIVRE